MRLFLNNLKLAIQKRRKSSLPKKSFESWHSKGYIKTPEVSIIIQSHNKSRQVEYIVSKLRQRKDMEIIVIDDGSTAEHSARLAEFLTGTNEFMIHANDLFENIMYDKTIRFANGRYVVLLQDDDDFDSTAWIDQGLQLFEQRPTMVILGGKNGLDVHFNDEQKIAHGGGEYEHGTNFGFVPAVNRAPMWINKELFEQHLRHIDYQYAPFQFDDYELCLRAWLCNLEVGWYEAGFHSLCVGGMRLGNGPFTQAQSQRNGQLLYKTYRNHINKVHELVKTKNETINH